MQLECIPLPWLGTLGLHSVADNLLLISRPLKSFLSIFFVVKIYYCCQYGGFYAASMTKERHVIVLLICYLFDSLFILVKVEGEVQLHRDGERVLRRF